MNPTNAYQVRRATETDNAVLRELAERDGQRSLSGPALIGEIGGTPLRPCR
jgi:hypothetical protein